HRLVRHRAAPKSSRSSSATSPPISANLLSETLFAARRTRARLAPTSAFLRQPRRPLAQCNKTASCSRCSPGHPPPVAKMWAAYCWSREHSDSTHNSHRLWTDDRDKELSQNPGGSFLCQPHLQLDTN